MPTTVNDQFYTLDPFSPPPAGTFIAFSNFNTTDQDDDGNIDTFNGDSVNGLDITASWPDDTVTVNVGGTNITYTGITFYLSDGSRVFTPTDGQVLQNGVLVSTTFVTSQGPLDIDNLGPACFTPGTLILTDQGEKLIEDIEPGDHIWTHDHGYQPVRHILSRSVDGFRDFAPVLIKAGALGNIRDILVSQQHRIYVSGWKVELMLGEDEALIAAKHLINDKDIYLADCEEVTYIHLVFDKHELVLSEGILTESFYYTSEKAETDPAAMEIQKLFPEVDMMHDHILARPALKRHEGALLYA